MSKLDLKPGDRVVATGTVIEADGNIVKVVFDGGQWPTVMIIDEIRERGQAIPNSDPKPLSALAAEMLAGMREFCDRLERALEEHDQ